MRSRIVALRSFATRRLPPAVAATATVVLETIRGFRADRGVDLAASLAFTTLLTAIPLLATFSILIAAVFDENDARFFDSVASILPYHTEFVMQHLRRFVAESAALSGIGLVLLIAASVRLIFVVEELVNAVWGAPRRRARLARAVLYVFVLLVLALLVGGLGRSLRSPSWFLLEIAALTLLYRYLPNAQVNWRSAAVASLVVTVLLELLRTLFGVYVDALSRMNLVAGSMSLALFVLISIYFVWALILLGVELTHVLQKTRRGRRNRGATPGRAENALRMLLRLAAGGSHEFRELYGEQEASSVEAEGLLGQLRDHGLIRGDRARGFALAESPEAITVARVVEAISPDLYSVTGEDKDPVSKVLAPLFAHLDAERRALLGATLADLRRM